MFEKLDIHNFGTYKNYRWSEHFVNEQEKAFGGRNIIYGRNYSGKTTLSRIFRCLEKGQNHIDFTNGEYCITLKNGDKVTNFDLKTESPLNVRVYNSDFKKENLDFLYNDDGEILPFTIIGEENIGTQKKVNQEEEKLKEVTKKLGNLENEGLRKKVKDTNNQYSELDYEFKKMLRDKASDIRNNSLFFIGDKIKRYDIRDIEKEIPNAVGLDKNKKVELETTLKEEVKEEIVFNPSFNLNYIGLLKKANNLLSVEVQPSKIIQELSDNNDLQEWVKNGIGFHKGKKDECALCGNHIHNTRWETLDQHFTKHLELFTQNLENLISEVNSHIEFVINYDLPIYRSDFYSPFQDDFNSIVERVEEAKKISKSRLHDILNKLEERQRKIFTDLFKVVISDDLSLIIEELQNDLLTLIKSNNSYTQLFTDKKKEARYLLRLNDIHSFKIVIDYDKKVSKLEIVNNQLKLLEEDKQKLESQERTIREHIKELEDSLKDEEKSVKQVNYYLRNFLGHHELHLAIDEKSNESEKSIKFTIMRNHLKAKNLSEGEQSLIAFCYFLATLKDIANVEDYTIFVDDPISSLDSNHIFYVFSLLDAEIASQMYQQVFISTHNLDFLKYLQRLTKPTGNNKYKNRYYFIEKGMNNQYESQGLLKKMPDYLKTYSTEFIYLFHQIYKVANETESDKNYQTFYNFPNIARKFLETYMFFKYPDFNMGNDQRILAFFDQSVEIKGFLNRINNEFSHGENQPDRLLRPIDIPEFKKNAQIIIESIKRKDREQFNAFMTSIGEESVGQLEST